MSGNEFSCCVCSSNEHVIVFLPRNIEVLSKWAECLEDQSIMVDSRKKKLCIRHFDQKWHDSLLNPACRRNSYCFPSKNPVLIDKSNNDTQIDPTNVPDQISLDNPCKKLLNVDAALDMKTSEIEHLKEEIKRQQQQITELETKIKQKSYISEICDDLNLSPNVRTMMNLLVSTKGRPLYSKDEISLCRSIYYKSSSAYSHLRQLLDNKLPSVRSLARWHDLKEFNVGLVQPVLNFLIQKRAELNDNDAEIILIVDEMDGRRDLLFDANRDEIVGFEDLFERTPKLAKKFLSVIVRGVNTKIENLILANFATANGIKGSSLAKLFKKLIQMLFSIGYKVRIITCDQSAVNRKAYASLGVTIDQPYFYVNDVQVFAFYDFPHLMKSARTLFLEKVIVSGNDYIDGSCVKKIYEAGLNDGHPIFEKLTHKHLYYDTFDKMRVSLAVQILSKSVSEGIFKMIEKDFFKTDQEKTNANNAAIFAEKLNNLFDMLNAKDQTDPNPLKRGLCADNIHIFRDLFKYVMTLEHIGKKVFWIDGMKQTVNGILLFFEEKHTENKDFRLMTRRLNQDALENLFGMIRAKGVNNRNPTLLDFLRTISKLITSSPNLSFRNSNCELDTSTEIKSLQAEFWKSDVNFGDDFLKDEENNDIEYVDETHENETEKSCSNVRVSNINIPIDGIIIKLKNKFNCVTCKEYDMSGIAYQVIMKVNNVIKKDPCMKNIVKNLSESICSKVHPILTCGHAKLLVDFALKTCLLKGVRNLKRGYDVALKKGKKPVNVSHYKLKILK